MASSDHIKPGGEGKITASVDVRGKLGKISKTIQVYSNDPKRPQLSLLISMVVRDEMHSKKHSAAEIFKGQCAKCHIGNGKGKKGQELYTSDCTMCHYYNKTAQPLNVLWSVPDDKLRDAIEKGVNGSSMPGWAISEGGPLTEQEVDSIIQFIKARR